MSAQAGHAYFPDGSFGSFGRPGSIAVDQANHYVYVIDINEGTIERFDSEGNPVNFSALGSPAGSTNVIDGSDDGTEDPDDTPYGMLTFDAPSAAQVSVDNSGGPNQGDIYVTSYFAHAVYIFDSSGSYIGELAGSESGPFSGNEQGELCGVTVDPNGNVYVAYYSGAVDRYAPEGTPADDSDFTGQIFEIGSICEVYADSDEAFVQDWHGGAFQQEIRRYAATAFTGVDNPAHQTMDVYGTAGFVDSNDDFYVNTGDRIVVLDGSGALKKTFAENVFEGSEGVAVDGTAVYIADTQNGKVLKYREGLVPDAFTQGANPVTPAELELTGHIDLAGTPEVTECYFDYGPTASYTGPESGRVDCEQEVPYAGAESVTARVGGLRPETAYHYRLVAVGGDGSSIGEDHTASTPPAVTDLSVDASEVTKTSAQLDGAFSGVGLDTTYRFEWGLTDEYGNVVPGDAGAGSGPTEFSERISGLQQATPYHYRLVATNSYGTTKTADKIFYAAPPDPPIVSGVRVLRTGPNSAVIGAEINPSDWATVYRIDFGTAANYGSSTPMSASVGEDSGEHSVETELTGLAQGTVYHFRITASNFGGTVHTADETFITSSPPRIVRSTASSVGTTTATLQAEIAPGSLATTYHFEYGPSSAYGNGTAESGLSGPDAVAQIGSVAVSGLASGTEYHFRTVATNALGTTVGPDATFATAQAPPSPPSVRQTKKCGKGKRKVKGKCRRRKKHRRRHRRHSRVRNGGRHHA